MNRPDDFGEFIRPYEKRIFILALRDGLITGLVICLAPALLTVFRGFSPGQLLLYLSALLFGFWLKAFRKGESKYSVIDRLTGSDGEILTLSDLALKDPENPFLPLLTERTRTRLIENPPSRCIPGNPGLNTVKIGALLMLLGAILVLPGLVFYSDPKPFEILSDAAGRLADAAELEPMFSPLAEELEELKDDLSEKEEEGTEKVPDEDWKELEELSRELTEQIRELERNSLTGLFEERGETLADELERLSRGDMSLPETREFIMDLLSDPGLDNEARNSIRQSFRDFSESTAGDQNPSRENQEKLAENLMEDMDPEGREFSRELRDILEDLEKLAEGSGEENERESGSERLTEEEPGRGGRESRRTGMEGAGPLESDKEPGGRSTAAAGKDPGAADGISAFESYEGEVPEVRLPEGEILERREQGILRLEGSESFRLERISPEYSGGPAVREEEIPLESIPEDKREIVQDYFLSIGS